MRIRSWGHTQITGVVTVALPVLLNIQSHQLVCFLPNTVLEPHPVTLVLKCASSPPTPEALGRRWWAHLLP